jgi:Arm DNA-binding domain
MLTTSERVDPKTFGVHELEVTERRTGKTVVRYQLTVDAGENLATGKRQQVRRRYATEKQARDALAEITQQASTDTFVPRKAVTVEELCTDWLASLHNARATTLNGYAYLLAPLREQHGHLPVQRLTRADWTSCSWHSATAAPLPPRSTPPAVVGAIAQRRYRRLAAGPRLRL